VVSPNDTYTGGTEKALAWLDAGSRMVFVADPLQRTVTVYRSLDDIRVLTEDATIDGGGVVPGWRLPVADLFG
jgi:hypothetical protein